MKEPVPVYLVGTGPGDPDLLTMKASRLLKQADVVVHDRLVSPAIMALARADARRISAGKASGRHELDQDEINALLLRLAREGGRVVRLKGGDPLIFGRGGEEALFLRAHGIRVEVVPGITSASGCTAELGIPLTHRGLATGVRFVTGHCREDTPLALNWASLADPDTTLVVYMGLSNAAEICARLVDHGLHPATPAAALASGTTSARQDCLGTLHDLPARILAAGLRSPVLLVIGRVVALAGGNACQLPELLGLPGFRALPAAAAMEHV
ncbi:MAG: uroporphyrinogen-III C-methyltransferase [Alphaproteobacteria bacterium]|nr:uroporphyrinogen-III C-methyltransferase [Alphaproteobacteria bacterium]